jgi:hypothetical protein
MSEMMIQTSWKNNSRLKKKKKNCTHIHHLAGWKNGSLVCCRNRIHWLFHYLQRLRKTDRENKSTDALLSVNFTIAFDRHFSTSESDALISAKSNFKVQHWIDHPIPSERKTSHRIDSTSFYEKGTGYRPLNRGRLFECPAVSVFVSKIIFYAEIKEMTISRVPQIPQESSGKGYAKVWRE